MLLFHVPLDVDRARTTPLQPASFNEAQFRYALNADAMATEKLAKGIRAFAVDSAKLDALIAAQPYPQHPRLSCKEATPVTIDAYAPQDQAFLS